MSHPTLNIRIDPETLAKLKQLAEIDNRSMSKQALHYIKQGIEKENNK